MADAMQAKEIVMNILTQMGMNMGVELCEEEDRIVLEIQGEDEGLIIGKMGQTLDALQYLVMRILHRGEEEQRKGKPIVIDAGGYRARRMDSLIAMAHRLAEKVIGTQQAIVMSPMSAHDRRIVHMALGKMPGVTTRSEGEGASRQLFIVPQPEKV